MAIGADLFELAQVEDCDVAVLPFHWEDTAKAEFNKRAQAFLLRASASGRPVLIFDNDDFPEPIRALGAVVFLRSLHASSRKPWEFAQPGWLPDPIGTHATDVDIRPYRSTPTVTFCGHAPPLGSPAPRGVDRVGAILRDLYLRSRTRAGFDERRGPHPPLFYRSDAVRRLARSSLVRTEFILRRVASDHGAIEGYKPMDGSMSAADYQRQYFKNILDGDYVLAVRGRGNYSMRFYEAMACGRIPLFVDTDCVLPLESTADWSNLIIRVDKGRIRGIDRDLLGRHRAMTEEEFTERQRNCRRLWEQALTMSGFFSWLHRCLRVARSSGPLVSGSGHARLIMALNQTS